MNQVFRLTLKREVCPVAAELGMLDDTFDSKDIVKLVARLTKDEPREVKYAFYFNKPGQLIGYQEVAVGGLDNVSWDARVVFSSALLCGASKIILVHNHPMSTNERCSVADIKSLKALIPGAEAIGLFIVDSMVVCGEKWTSMRDFGLMPSVREVVKEAEKLAAEGDQP